MARSASRVVLLQIGICVALSWCSLASSRAADPESGWCGEDTTKDWVCPTQGSVYAVNRLLRPELPVPINDRRLTTFRSSSARLAFGDQANCALGELSQIYPGGKYPDTIFTQRRGSASCVSSRPSRVRIACGRVERCPTELRANGAFLFKTLSLGATASTVTIKRQRIQIVSCQGFVEVRVFTPGGVQEASGGGSAGSSLVITIVVTSKVVERSWGVVSEEFATVKSVARDPNPEECESSAVQEEEEVVRP